MPAPELFYVTPRVVVAGGETEIAVSGRFPHTDLRGFAGEPVVDAVGGDGLFRTGELSGFTCGNGVDLGRPNWEPVKCSAPDAAGTVRFRYEFRSEGESCFQLRCGERVLAKFSVYALRPEWHGLRPFRGDMHLHSGYSCCCQEQDRLSPEYYAACNRARGMDFISISDHKQYFPSLKAADFIRQCGGGFRVYPGEEIHLHDLHNIHELNFGGDRPVSNQLRRGDTRYDRDLAKYMAVVPAWSDELCRYMAANFHIIADRVREAGGAVIFCHPFWRPLGWLFLPRPVREYVMEKQLFDALELFGYGALNCDETDAMYFESCLRAGRRIPAVGTNDAHKLETLAKNSTVIFAERNEFPALKAALLANLNVAVNGSCGDLQHVSGRLELVSFYHFLRRDYYPRHDAICVREADEIFRTLATGGPDPEYDAFIRRPYPEHVDGPEAAWQPRRFTPDAAAMAAVGAEMAALDREFWGL